MAGVVNSSVGYLGGPEVAEGANVTYRTVSDGDGNTEALRLVYNTSVVTFEDLARRYFRDPRVPHVYEGWELTKPQYRVAVWATDEEQAEIAKRVSEEEGKRVPVLEAKAWNEAEGWHQHFLGEFKDFPEDDDDDD